MTDLHRPVFIRHEAEPRGSRVPWMRVKIVTVLVRLATIENRTFQLEPAIRESRSEHAKADVRRILQVMRESRRRIFRSRHPMHEGHRAQRRLTRITKICEPGSALAQRQRVLRRQLHEEIMRMLSVD